MDPPDKYPDPDILKLPGYLIRPMPNQTNGLKDGTKINSCCVL